jgi:uncharacterized sporulation protein YeaH/YhbH (DUF444 family)
VVQASALERVVQLPRAVRGQHDRRAARGPQRPELGHGHREVLEQLEQEGLERVVRAVDLVDEQHHLARRLERVQQRPADEELLRPQVHVARPALPELAARRARSWRGWSQS